MPGTKGAGRRASGCRSQRSKATEGSATASASTRSTHPLKPLPSSIRTRVAIRRQSDVFNLPNDLWNVLLRFLTWRETNAMLRVSSSWRKRVIAAKNQHPEWRSTVLGPAANAAESLELLGANHLQWADTRFAPDLVLLSVASRNPTPWHNGSYWADAVAVIEEEKLLPTSCRIVGVFTMNAVMAQQEEFKGNVTSPEFVTTLSISVLHLPETKVEMAAFERKELRRHHRGGAQVENPFQGLGDKMEMPSFLMFGVNDQSASELVPLVEEWHPGSAVVGAVSPLMDRCAPIATYHSVPTKQPDRHQERQRPHKNGGRQRQQNKRHQSRRRLRPKVDFPSMLLIRFLGKVGVRAFASSGYDPITPVVRCERVSVEEDLNYVTTYDLVSVKSIESAEPVCHRIMDLLEPPERLAIEREGKGLNIFSCREKAPLDMLAGFNSALKSDLPPEQASLAQIDRLEFVFWVQGGLMSLPERCWEQGSYGFLASVNPAGSSRVLTETLKYATSALESQHEHAFGVFMIMGAMNEIEDEAHASEVAITHANTFRDIPLGGCIVSNSVGPVAFPGGLYAARGIAQVQTHTTCGAIFYTKTEGRNANSAGFAQWNLND